MLLAGFVLYVIKRKLEKKNTKGIQAERRQNKNQ
jgi:hypothetical protein